MTRYGAKVEDGVVTQVLVLADGADGDNTAKALELVEEDGVLPGIGWSWNGSSFAAAIVLRTWDDVRAERDRLLAASDWSQMPDNALDAPTIAAWAAYRQALRDIPQTQDDPDNIVWPEAP